MSHEVDLNWIASPSIIDGYFVYRSSQPGGPYSRINDAPVLDTSFVDSDVSAGQTYFYVVTAVASGVESAYSNESEANVPTP